ncbi:Vegetative incompatibility protein [Paramyrothecium foliicola]|nr:Vegetative incompatibility protein [Paramyrothecium foliicola]
MDPATGVCTKIVYRLRGIPHEICTPEEVCNVLSECFKDFTADDFEVGSLATSFSYWDTSSSKVATLRFKKCPSALNKVFRDNSWDLSELGPYSSLVLDRHFLGLTPLNDVDAEKHLADCIAISGLGSHPFGSWQPHGPQKNFMWLRDEAPSMALGVRMILYGHDSGIIHSSSFQLISDIARDFIEHLRLGGWASPTAPSLLFLAHSLGGIILKDALIQIADARNDFDRSLITKFKGAVMFGVPDLGMEQAHLLAMVEGQPNETLIQDLSRNSNYLARLDESFSGTTFLSQLTIFWAYELLQSHTVIVDKHLSRSQDIRLTLPDILRSLDAPDLGSRQTSIEDNYATTFEWFFEHREFTDWLGCGRGVFWINGKPGSGKSTLMKFIFEHQRTRELLHDWKIQPDYALIGFFFHHRGSAMQKSFEGLLRSLLKQILQQREDLSRYMSHFYEENSSGELKQWTTRDLEAALHALLTQKESSVKLCLFFDALDEFQGHLDRICRFVKDLVELPSGSTSSVKVCFSSRPWDIFTNSFSDCPKFSLQDFTSDDIRNYCVGMIGRADAPTHYLRALVPDIVQRAAGVFLWVSLVVKDLSNALVDADRNTGTIEVLRDILYTLPLELDNYYQQIIERLPQSRRWETYALLELVIRDSSPGLRPTPQYICQAVSVSQSRTYEEASTVLSCHGIWGELMSKQPCDPIFIKHISLWGGGLVEIKQNRVQLMHQTVFEFVTSLKFKEIVLGDLAKITYENGHVFHMKCLFVQPNENLCTWNYESLVYHAQGAEVTTGISQEHFLSSIPNNVIAIKTLGSVEEPSSLFAFAAYASLALFWRDVVKKGPIDWDDKTKEPLVQSCIDGKLDLKEKDLAIVKIIIENGYNPKADTAFCTALLDLHTFVSIKDPRRPLWIELCILLLEYGCEQMELDDEQGLSPLHIAPPAVAERLLDLGADPNVPDFYGRTPLDFQLMSLPRQGLERSVMPPGKQALMEEIHEFICLLVKRGGKTAMMPLQDYTKALYRFERELGRDMSDLWHAVPSSQYQ